MPADSLQCSLSSGQEMKSVSNSDNEFSETGKKKIIDDIPQNTLRDFCWTVGKHFPLSLNQEGIVFLAVNPHLGFIQWHINENTATQLKDQHKTAFEHGCRLVVRIYDITGIDFNGFNAGKQFDIDIHGLSGCYYLKIDQTDCNLLAEIGFRFSNDRFVPCARSNTMNFNRPRRSSKFNFSGLYVSHGFTRIFTVENTICGSVFDRMNRSLEYTGNAPLSVAVFLNESSVVDTGKEKGPIASFLETVLAKCKIMRATPYLFTPVQKQNYRIKGQSLNERVLYASADMLTRFTKAHREKSFDCVQCHDWYSAPAAITAASDNGLPLTCVLHSIEIERAGSNMDNPVSKQIESWERQVISAADNVLVARESTRQIVIEHYAKSAERVGVVADNLAPIQDNKRDNDFIRVRYGLNDQEPLILFAGEMAHHTGVDLLVDALPNVCREFGQGKFLFAGEGYLKQEMEKRAWYSGVGHRCRFLGDVQSELFDSLLLICDAVVIPARSRQSGELADLALKAGKPVMATHQAGLHNLVHHGQNGVLVYDNPGSLCWGIKELLTRPFNIIPRSASDESGLLRSAECVAAMYITYWAYAVALRRGVFCG